MEIPALKKEIVDLINKRGKITFADFMELALYHPEHGYYTSGKEKIGKKGDYYTSSDVHPVFGELIARQLEQMWRLMGKGRFTVVEMGAGKGWVCYDIINLIRNEFPEFFEEIDYKIVEISRNLIERQSNTLKGLEDKVSWESFSEDGFSFEPVVGSFLSNEFVDSLPVHQVVVEDNCLKEIKTRQKMRRVARHIHRSAEKDQNLTRAAQEYKLTVKTTPFFSKDNHVLPEIGATPEFFNQVFSLEDNKVGEPVQTFEATFVSKIIAREKSYVPELSDVQKLAEEKSQEEKDRIFSIKKSEEFAQKISDGTTDLESVIKKLGLDLKHSPFFNQSDSIPGIGNLKKVKAKAFELDIGKSGWVSERNKYYLIRVQDREKASAPDPEDLKELTTRLKLDKGNSVFQEWMENLKERSEILIDKTQL